MSRHFEPHQAVAEGLDGEELTPEGEAVRVGGVRGGLGEEQILTDAARIHEREIGALRRALRVRDQVSELQTRPRRFCVRVMLAVKVPTTWFTSGAVSATAESTSALTSGSRTLPGATSL